MSITSKPYYVSNKDLHAEYVKWYADIELAEKHSKTEPQIPSAIVDAIMKICTKLSYSPEFINYSFREDLVGDAIYDCVRFVKKFNPSKILHKAVLLPISGNIQIKDMLIGDRSELTGTVKYKNNKTDQISLKMHQDKDFHVGEAVSSKNGTATILKITTHTADNPFSYITTIAYNAFRRRIDDEKTESYIKAKILSETPIHEFFESLDSDDLDLVNAFTDFLSENSDNMVNNEPMIVKRKRKKLEEKIALEEVELGEEGKCLEIFEDE